MGTLLSGLRCADLINVFEVFLPQLLLYPNPTDPLNGEAAALMMRDREHYEQKVKGTTIPMHNQTCGEQCSSCLPFYFSSDFRTF